MRHLSDGVSTLILAAMAKTDRLTDNFGDTSHRAEGLPVYVAQIAAAKEHGWRASSEKLRQDSLTITPGMVPFPP